MLRAETGSLMNPHAVLGVANDATPDQIKAAYRKLAMKHHPDRNGGSDDAAKKFQEIQSAYDMLRSDKPKAPQQEEMNFHHAHMHDIFDHFFTRAPQVNPSLQAVCDITLEQAFSGCAVTFSVNGKSVVVDIPAGANHGHVIRIAEGAGKPNPNLPAGDLHVVIRLKPHDRFQRHGMTLLSVARVELLDLLIGKEIEIRTITGEPKKVTIPENSNPTTVLTVAGEGMPAMNSSSRGDLMIHFEVDYPPFSKRNLASLRKMKKA